MLFPNPALHSCATHLSSHSSHPGPQELPNTTGRQCYSHPTLQTHKAAGAQSASDHAGHMPEELHSQDLRGRHARSMLLPQALPGYKQTALKTSRLPGLGSASQAASPPDVDNTFRGALSSCQDGIGKVWALSSPCSPNRTMMKGPLSRVLAVVTTESDVTPSLVIIKETQVSAKEKLHIKSTICPGTFDLPVCYRGVAPSSEHMSAGKGRHWTLFLLSEEKESPTCFLFLLTQAWNRPVSRRPALTWVPAKVSDNVLSTT